MKRYEVTVQFKNTPNRINKLVAWADSPEEAIRWALKSWRCDPEMVILNATII